MEFLDSWLSTVIDDTITTSTHMFICFISLAWVARIPVSNVTLDRIRNVVDCPGYYECWSKVRTTEGRLLCKLVGCGSTVVRPDGGSMLSVAQEATQFTLQYSTSHVSAQSITSGSLDKMWTVMEAKFPECFIGINRGILREFRSPIKLVMAGFI